jgi:hypothetical protein
MANINNIERITIVSYKIEPIPAIYKNSLDQYLCDTVWGYSSRVDESIWLETSVLENKEWINEVRYQFGECYCVESAKEIGELILRAIPQWSAKVNYVE